MDFLGMGMGEILLILVVALLIWGPGRIPEITRTLGRMVYTLRKTTSDLTTAVTQELNTEEKNAPPPSRADGSHEPGQLAEPSDADRTDPNTTTMTRSKDQ